MQSSLGLPKMRSVPHLSNELPPTPSIKLKFARMCALPARFSHGSVSSSNSSSLPKVLISNMPFSDSGSPPPQWRSIASRRRPAAPTRPDRARWKRVESLTRRHMDIYRIAFRMRVTPSFSWLDPFIMSSLKPYKGTSRKLVVALDVGTTFSGASYVILDPGDIPTVRPVSRYAQRLRVGHDFESLNVLGFPDKPLGMRRYRPLFCTTMLAR